MLSNTQNVAAVQLSGTTAGRSVPCFRFRTESGEEISITGDIAALREAGIQAKVTGTWQSASNCQQGRTLRVTQVEILNR